MAPASLEHASSGFGARWGRRLAWILPTLVALARTSPTPQWDADAAILRDYALAPVGFGGGVSTALAQIFAGLPLGTIGWRTGLPSLIALAVALAALVGTIERLVGALFERSDRARTWIAVLFTLLVGLGAPLQIEATRPGSSLVATALALVALRTLLGFFGSPSRTVAPTLLALGPLLGLAVAESPPIGGLAFVAIVLGLAAGTRLDGRLRAIPRRAIVTAIVASVASAVVFSLPPLLRTLVAHDGLVRPDFAVGHAVVSGATMAPASIAAELGLCASALALVGIVTVLASRRRATIATSALVLVICFVASHAVPALEAGRHLGVAAVGALAAVGAFALVERAARLPFGKVAVRIAFAAQAAIVALVSEDASARADRGELVGASTFTDLFLVATPAESALVVHDPSVARRLVTAQVHDGARPDVLVVVAPWLADDRVASRVLSSEPEAESLVRTTMLTGGADEFALARLADERPLLVEPRPGLTRRVEDYLLVSGYWLAFSPHPVGAVDRRAAVDGSLLGIRRLAATVRPDPIDDPTTGRVVASALGGITDVLVDLDDTEGASAFFAIGRSLPSGTSLHGISVEARFVDAASRLVATRNPKKMRAKAGDRAGRAR